MADNVTPEIEKDILERSILGLVRILDKYKYYFVVSIILGGIAGIGYSFLLPKKYTASVELVPDYNMTKLANLSSLASFAGISGESSGGEGVRPDFYPKILTSVPASLYLLNQPVESDSGKVYPTLFDFHTRNNKVKIDRSFLKAPSMDSIYSYSPSELGAISSVRGSVNANYDKKSGIVLILVEMTDPKIATMVLAHSIKYLKDYTREYQFGKKRDQGKFIGAQLKDAKKRMESTRSNLQSYKDYNRNLFTNSAKIQQQKLQEDYSIAYSIYNELLGESERLEITSKDEKPIFQILAPPIVPTAKSSPNRPFFGLGGAVLSLLATLLFILIPWKRLFAKN